MQENLGEFHLFHSWVRSSLPSRWINGKMTEETARTRLSTFNIERCVVLVAIRTIPNIRHVLLSFKRQLERGFISVATIVVMRIFLHIHPLIFPVLVHVYVSRRRWSELCVCVPGISTTFTFTFSLPSCMCICFISLLRY